MAPPQRTRMPSTRMMGSEAAAGLVHHQILSTARQTVALLCNCKPRASDRPTASRRSSVPVPSELAAGVRQLSAVHDDHLLARLAAAGTLLLNAVHHVHALEHRAEHDVAPVQPSSERRG